MSELARRQSYSLKKIAELRGKFVGAEEFAASKACVYATGSFGRCEASEHSDLDLFIAGKSEILDDGHGREKQWGPKNSLNHLDEICIQAELIKSSRLLGFEEFSKDGFYLNRHSIYEFINALGTEKDDVTNTFTARLLLLLESRPLLENGVYEEVIRAVIESYWRDYEDHKEHFMPAFLANDIIRLWRTFCVNYEAGTKRKPDEKKADGKLKNFKLKHSRLLTCYSALLYLLTVFQSQKSVTPEAVLEMTKLTPIERLTWLTQQSSLRDAHATIFDLVSQYEQFLQTTNCAKKDLIDQFMDKEKSRVHMEAANKFGDLMFKALAQIGNGSSFHRVLVV